MTVRSGAIGTNVAGGFSAYVNSGLQAQVRFGVTVNPVLLLHFNGTAGSQTFTDSSPSNHTVTANNSAQIDIAQSKFGGASGLFDGGNGASLTLDGSADFAFGTGDFTVDFQLRMSAIPASFAVVYDSRPAETQGLYPEIYVSSDGSIRYFTNSANQITGSVLSVDTWYHIALTRSGTSTKLFVDGTQVGSTYTDSNDYLNGADAPRIGDTSVGVGTGLGLTGWIDELRVIDGYAAWTDNFTPPNAQYQLDAGNLSVNATIPSGATQWQGAASFAGVGALRVDAAKSKSAAATFAGTGNLSVQATIAVGGTQWQGAGTFAGSGSFVPQVYVSPRIQVSWAEVEFVQSVTVWQGQALFSGTGNLSAYARLNGQIAVRYGGVGALSVDSTKYKSAAATFAGIGNLSADSTKSKSAAAIFNGIGNLNADSSKSKTAAAIFAGISNLSVDTTQITGGVQQQIAATFAGIGNLRASVALANAAAAIFNAVGSLSADSRKISPVAATFGALGNLRVLVNQQNSAAAIFGGIGNFNVFASITGATNQWSGEALFAGIGALNAGVRQNYQSAITFGGVGNLSALSAISNPIAVTFGGVGNFSASVSLSRTLAATFAGIGNLSALPNLRMMVAATFGGIGNFNAFGSVTGATNVWQGTANFAGQGNLSVNVISALQAAIRFGGLGNVSADSGKYKFAAATFAGVCNVGVSAANIKFAEIQFAGSSNLSIGTISQMQSGAIFAGQGFMRANIAGGRGPRSPTRTGISGETVTRRPDQVQTMRRRKP